VPLLLVVLAGLAQEILGRLGTALGEPPVARLVVDVVLEPDLGRLGLALEAKDVPLARRSFSFACDKGDADACNRLGALEHGAGLQDEALRAFGRACDGEVTRFGRCDS
jgi:TPR repeat protein